MGKEIVVLSLQRYNHFIELKYKFDEQVDKEVKEKLDISKEIISCWPLKERDEAYAEIEDLKTEKKNFLGIITVQIVLLIASYGYIIFNH